MIWKVREVVVRSRVDANDGAARAEARERSVDQETLQRGALQRTSNRGLAKEQLDRIICPHASILTYGKDNVWFHFDEVKKHMSRVHVRTGHCSGSRKTVLMSTV